jgi:carbamoyl-phosphate synthase large subunit
MNILLTSVGRRSYLVDYFKQAAQPEGRVVAANSDALTSGMIAADKAYTVPRVDSEKYISVILDICQTENIGLVVSLFDIDLPYLANARQQFIEKGIELVVSDPWVIDVANDKWATWEHLNEHGIQTPRTFLDVGTVLSEIEVGLIDFPLIIKPRWGMGSMSIFRADDKDELAFFHNYAQRQIEKSYLNILSHEDINNSVVIQEFIEGNEFGLDVFNDLQGNYLQTIAKQKIAMRSGETDSAKIVDDLRLIALGGELSNLFKHRGNIDVDILESKVGDLYVLEINARFGGGYPFSHLAGADYPAALIAMAEGRSVEINVVENGCVGLKDIKLTKASA